ncbi:MAG: hypothetical protein ACI9XC_000841 [Gammaproteobacteria bacterium]|jgi:hypothetical protein
MYSVNAQESPPATDVDNTGQVENYNAEFFTRYRPSTALDMVNQLPGFQLDDGDGSSRGLASSAGNLLINGRRLSAKQDLPSAALFRIPASLVEKIELIRGQAGGVDFQGHSVLANVYLRTEIPAAVRWELWVLQNNVAPIKPAANISLSHHISDIDYNVGIDVERDTSGWVGVENVFDNNDVLIATGPDDRTETGFRINSLSLNASSWLGDNFVQLNSRFTGNNSKYRFPSSVISQLPGGPVLDVNRETDTKNREYEVGSDIERRIITQLTGKAILLYTKKVRNDDSTRQNIDSILGQTLFRFAQTDTTQKELITRLEFDWSGFSDHAIQFNVERAYNVLDRSLFQSDDRGGGPVEVDVPGANSRVEEDRWDFLLLDNWKLGEFELDYGIGAETSTLSQTGDAELERTFFFLKPLAVLSYAPGQGKQTRLRLAREVSQLNLNDFVSATVFEDDDLALGNPNIQPDTTWVAEFTHERRFASESVIKLTAFHHWISNVLDLLPLSPNFEAPGNIGDGRRWGLQLESTIPLTFFGLSNARVDLKALWQDSIVTDPVTGEDRRLSGQGGQGGYRSLQIRNKNIKYHLRADFRQDFDMARVAWGWTIADRGNRPLYKVNELDVNSEGVAIDAFVETTRWFGIKTRLQVDNTLAFNRRRDRTLFIGERDLTPVESTINNNRYGGRRITLFLNGSF